MGTAHAGRTLLHERCNSVPHRQPGRCGHRQPRPMAVQAPSGSNLMPPQPCNPANLPNFETLPRRAGGHFAPGTARRQAGNGTIAVHFGSGKDMSGAGQRPGRAACAREARRRGRMCSPAGCRKFRQWAGLKVNARHFISLVLSRTRLFCSLNSLKGVRLVKTAKPDRSYR